ncbi:MAG: ABC transporter substrate-binding protein [Chitinivibrionales bacterium]|nr:ABC transporter substrate-binding protein [Chitinivibrionales bacterium]
MRNRFVCFSSVLAVIIIASLFLSCQKKGAAVSDSIKIGIFEPMTGANAAGGEMEVEGVKLANQLYPEVLGKKIELVIVDNKSDKVEAANAAERLVNKEKVVAMIGSWGSSYCIAAGPVVKDKVPAVAASATNPLVTKGNDWYFRVCFIDPFQGKVMANYAYHTLKARKAGIIQEISNDYSVGLARFFMDAFIGLTGDSNAIVGKPANYNTGDNDFTAQVTTIAALKPDVIFAPGNYSESALLIKQAKDQGIKIPFIGGDTWETPEFVDIGKAAVEGTVFSTFFTSEVPITKMSEVFLTEYRKQYNKEPAAVTALGFDAYLVIRAAIEKAGSVDPKLIRDQIAKTKDFEGAAGIITLDENGDAVKNAVIKTVKEGKFSYLSTVTPTN